MQYQAGYFLSIIFDLFSKRADKEKMEKILFQLGHFELETNVELNPCKADCQSEIKTILNIVQRGVPTFPSVFIEDLFSTAFGIIKRQKSPSNSIFYSLENDSISDEIYKAIHIIEPRISAVEQKSLHEVEAKSGGTAGTRFDFKYSYFPEYLGQYFIQLFEENKTFEEIAGISENENTEEIQSNFSAILGKKQDFILEMPYKWRNEKGVTVELDDTHTETTYDFETDQLKQKLCNKIGWSKPIEIATSRLDDIHNQLRPLIDFTYNEYFDTIAKNYRSPLYKSNDGLTALQLTLSPLAIARLERTILEFLLAGKLSLNDRVWKIAVIERDVPCAYIALQDLKLHFENIFALQEGLKKFPELSLHIYVTQEFKKCRINQIYPGEIKLLENFDEHSAFDLLIDIAVLQRSGLLNETYKTNSKNIAIIRSAHNISTRLQYQNDNFINYIDLDKVEINEKRIDRAKEALKYFLRNIFRKDGFLPGQIQIINQILQQKNTLGLLPPAGGKTIAYQLPAFLQPGCTFSICPNSNLIDDHIDSLEKLKIKSSISLVDDSSKYVQNKRKKDRILDSAVLFIFLVPKHLHSREFKDLLLNLENKRLFINQIVVDEAHCVSEWSHSFDPLYHKLGHIKNLWFKNPVRQKIPLVALSGTANYSTIYDIQREFLINSNCIVKSNIVHPKVKISLKPKQKLLSGHVTNDKYDYQNFNAFDEEFINKLIGEVFAGRESNSDHSTLVYFPDCIANSESTSLNQKGFDEKNIIKISKLRIAQYIGSNGNISTDCSKFDQIHSKFAAESFRKNNCNLLIASPEYAIGSNKTNLRNIVFLDIPQSVEHFIQQTSRGGRDGNEIQCTLFCDNGKPEIKAAQHIKISTDKEKTSDTGYYHFISPSSVFKGREKELAIHEQLWNGYYPESITYAEAINRLIEDKYNLDTELILQPNENPKRVYINQGNNTFGFVNLSDFSISIEESSFERSISKEIIRFVAFKINHLVSQRKNNALVLKELVQSGPCPGLVKELNQSGQTPFHAISLPYENDGIDKISVLIADKCCNVLTKKDLRQLFKQSNTADEFIEKILLDDNYINNTSLKEEIRKLFLKTWNKNEIQLAIYRLSKLGIIDDYTVDEFTRQFTVILKKNDNQFFINRLFHLYELFLLPEQADIEKKSITGSTLHEILIGHIDFYYNYIHPFRLESTESIQLYFRQVISDNIPANQLNQSINELMERYFGAKFAIQHFSPVPGIKPLMDNIQGPAILKDYLSRLGPLKENLFHLKKSVKLISMLKPDNYLASLLDSYIQIIYGVQEDEKIDKAFNQVITSLITLRKQAKVSGDLYKKEIQEYLDVLYQYKPLLREKYEPIFWLRMHYMWLKDFNSKMNQY